MQAGFEIAVTLKGTSLKDILTQAQALIDSDGTPTTTTPVKRGRKAAAPVEDTQEEMLLDGAEETATDDEDTLGFDTEPEAKPKKKAAKLTEKDVNTAAMAYAKVHGRPKTLAILTKKFKVKSILELEPEQYAAVITALEV